MISKNAMKTFEFDDSIFYRVACSCGADEHDITVEFERDNQIESMIFLNFHKNVSWCPGWEKANIFQKFWKRLTGSLRMLFTGYIEVEESFILSENNIQPFIDALIEGKGYIENKRTDHGEEV